MSGDAAKSPAGGDPGKTPAEESSTDKPVKGESASRELTSGGLTSERGHRAIRTGFGLANLVTALLLYIGVFQGLPSRYWPVDATAVVLMALFAAAGWGLLAQASWAPRVAWVASTVSLALGLLLVTTLAVTASYLSGIYGPVGRGGALILTLTAALSLPYLVVVPAVQLLWLGPLRAMKGEPAKVVAPSTSSGS
jgi:hypothetical protein